ncbi:MAG: M48 family metalloprotease [Candidatus Liptonbacteria bacterium]|nr:M48 family metalloprotease [Candidatus Liptonbacteria bacterium]
MASLYSQRDANIRRTWFLLGSFLILVIAIGFVFAQAYRSPGILYLAVALAIGMNLIGYFASDQIALAMARAQPIQKKDNPYLWNMVENLAITAGLPMPRVFVTPELQVNAFATGRDPKHAAIAVTAGALQKLENEELEGVLAHELSHVGNRDTLVMTVAVILAGIISIASDFFLRSMWFGGGGGHDRDSDNRGGNLFAVVGIALAILAPIGAMLIQLAISRKREFLADASGALLTRYPEGLARALEKIGGDRTPMQAASDATAHLWISNPFKGKAISGFHKLFLTHPPIAERIAALRGMAT